MYIKIYDDINGKLIGYQNGNNFHTIDFILPDSAEINEGNPPTQEQINNKIQKNNALNRLSILDKKMPRNTEDLYTILKAKNILSDSDMPQEFIDNYNEKQTERAKL